MAFRDASAEDLRRRAIRRWQQELDRIQRLGTRAPFEPNVPKVLNLPNQGGFAANDPRIQTSSGGGIRGVFARLGRATGLLGVASAVAELLIEDKIRQRELDIQSGFEALERKREKLRAERGIMREVLVRSDDTGLAPESIFSGAAAIPSMRVPTAPQPDAVSGGLAADPQAAIRVPVADPITIPDPVPGPIAAPVGPPAVSPAPAGDPAPVTAPVPASIPVPLPSTVATPGFGIPTVPTPFPSPAPVSFPVAFPARSPARQPVGDLFPLTGIEPTTVGSEPTTFGFVEDLPQPVALAQAQTQRRCRPCPEDNPKPRDGCYKGLYVEGFLDNDVSYTEWAEVDCLTGREL